MDARPFHLYFPPCFNFSPWEREVSVEDFHLWTLHCVSIVCVCVCVCEGQRGEGASEAWLYVVYVFLLTDSTMYLSSFFKYFIQRSFFSIHSSYCVVVCVCVCVCSRFGWAQQFWFLGPRRTEPRLQSGTGKCDPEALPIPPHSEKVQVSHSHRV